MITVIVCYCGLSSPAALMFRYS